MTLGFPMRFAFAVTLLASAVASSHAATIVVSPNGALDSLQAGVDAAQAGDTVLVKAGTYFGTVTIDTPKASLVLKAQGKVIVDASLEAGAPQGAGFLVLADDVTIRGFEVRHAQDISGNDGDGVRSTGLRTRIEKCRFDHCERSGVLLSGADSIVKSCAFFGSPAGVGIDGATGTRVSNSRFERLDGNGVEFEATAGVIVEQCVFVSLVGAGVVAFGNSPNTVVRKCRFEALEDGAIALESTGAVIENNKIRSCGYGLFCVIPGGVVRKNVVSFGFGPGEAFGLETSDDVLVEDNVAKDFCGQAFRTKIGSDNVVFRDNVAIRCGTEGFGAFDIAGVGHQFEDCVALLSAAGGFEIAASEVSFDDCLAKNCAIDGFDFGNTNGINVVLNDCAALGNGAEGIENSANGTVLTDCVAKNNRTDVANNGSFATFDVTFVTGGQGTSPAIE